MSVRVLSDPSGWFTMDLAEGWATSTEDGVTTLRGPRDQGTLFLAAARHAGGRQVSFGGADFLARFLRSLGMAVDEKEIELRAGTGCRIYSLARENHGAHWHYWSVTDDETALLISYTSPEVAPEGEHAEVEAMVRSVRLYHPRKPS